MTKTRQLLVRLRTEGKRKRHVHSSAVRGRIDFYREHRLLDALPEVGILDLTRRIDRALRHDAAHPGFAFDGEIDDEDARERWMRDAGLLVAIDHHREQGGSVGYEVRDDLALFNDPYVRGDVR